MLNSKKEKLKNLENKEVTEVIKVSGLNMPDILANLTTGLDVNQIELQRLIDAPSEWNFYSPLSISKMDELVESIKNIGLMHPVVVWEQEDETYMILSGHNRKKAYELLLEETEDTKYKKIHCYIKKRLELSEDEAKEIIIDTNWVQRQLSPMERAKSIFEKYTKIKRSRDNFDYSNKYEGLTRDLIAQQYNMTGRQVSNYYRLNYLIPDIKTMVGEEKISIKSGVKMSGFHPLLQQYIFNKFRNKMDNRIIQKIDPTMSEEQINEIFSSTNDEQIEVSYKVFIKKDYKSDFNKDLKELVIKYNAKLN